MGQTRLFMRTLGGTRDHTTRTALLSALRRAQYIFAAVGIAWCVAALWVEYKLEVGGHIYAGPDYVPFCDFAPWAKCSKVLMSPIGRLMRFIGVAAEGDALDLPNPFMGLLFFSCHLAYPYLKKLPLVGSAMPLLATLVCVFVAALSCFLAYILFIVLEDFCIVCVSSYAVNFALLYVMHAIYAAERSEEEKLAAKVA